MPAELSVIVCAHNPQRRYWVRMLASLRLQDLAQEHWELLIVDNNSQPPLETFGDISWHRNARIVREPQQGLTRARLRGIAETHAPVMVFVDDDNELSADYLSEALRIGAQRTDVGAWGGSITPAFEIPPREDYAVFLPSLALRSVSSTRWATDGTETCPYGAGLCIRREVALAYAAAATGCRLRLSLGRSGKSLAAGEDLDMALFAHKLGLATGLFPGLRLRHMISADRLEPGYLYRACVSGMAALHVVRQLHGQAPLPRPSRRPLQRWVYRLLHWLGRLPAHKIHRLARIDAAEAADRILALQSALSAGPEARQVHPG